MRTWMNTQTVIVFWWGKMTVSVMVPGRSRWRHCGLSDESPCLWGQPLPCSGQSWPTPVCSSQWVKIDPDAFCDPWLLCHGYMCQCSKQYWTHLKPPIRLFHLQCLWENDVLYTTRCCIHYQQCLWEENCESFMMHQLELSLQWPL